LPVGAAPGPRHGEGTALILVTVGCPGAALASGDAVRHGGCGSVLDTRGHGGLGRRDPLALGLLVGHREQATDAAGDGVLREGRVGVVAELVEARVAVCE